MNKRSRKTHQHILDVASRLFYQQGIRAVGVDTIVAKASIAKMTLYNHFKSKDDLIIAYLTNRCDSWIEELTHLPREGEEPDPKTSVLIVFDCLDDLLNKNTREAFRGCPFLNASAEIADETHPAREVVRHYMEKLVTVIETKVGQMETDKKHELAEGLIYLLYGAMSKAMMTGDSNTGVKAKKLAEKMMADYT